MMLIESMLRATSRLVFISELANLLQSVNRQELTVQPLLPLTR